MNEDIACLTIVSKNYLSFARVLCKSFLDNHPGSTFYVLLVDEIDDYFSPEEEKFRLIRLDDINLPNKDIFPYQYSILELNTAVKPYVLKYIFSNFKHTKVAYIDPDIKVYQPLDDVWLALDRNSIVLTPHMRKPYFDNKSPTELNILQSGTYNLGFIGLRNTENTHKLLEWWMGKLYLDCTVDIASGLFTDQKWIDFVPAYFEDVYILREPSYNVAYWNLHERDVKKDGDNYYVDGKPLKFFHFSGYNPRISDKLSKHQNRHDLADFPDLKSLCDSYKTNLLEEDYENTIEWTYAFDYLQNNINIIYPMHQVIRRCLKLHIPFPSPRSEPDKFCKFLLTPNAKIYGKKIAPLYYALLKIRPDVVAAFPRAMNDANDPGFNQWLNNSGTKEYPIELLIKKYGHLNKYENSVSRIGKVYQSRSDLHKAIPDAWKNNEGLNKFIEWLKRHGVKEYDDLLEEDIEVFRNSTNGVYKILSLYCLRIDLHKVIYNWFTEEGLIHFHHWLRENLPHLPNVTENEVEVFNIWAKNNYDICLKFILIYNTYVRELLGGMPTVFREHAIIGFCKQHNAKISQDEILHWLTSEYITDIYEHYLYFYASDKNSQDNYPDILDDAKKLTFAVRKELLKWAIKEWRIPKWFTKVITEKVLESRKKVINIAGYFDSNTGMGQSSRCMLKILECLDNGTAKFNLPNIYHNYGDFDIPGSGALFGIPSAFSKNNIFVSNADTTELSHQLFPSYIFQVGRRKKIGYWVWETDELPKRWAYLNKIYDEIWTPSNYSAQAIRKTIDLPVRVVSHVLDREKFSNIEKNRSKFNLPDDTFLFGFFFDSKSVLERKNPKAVIEAFINAFPIDDNYSKVGLLMKINSSLPGNYEYECIKYTITDKRILWYEKELSGDDTLQLMKCLDAYVSLHRSEGFGLTIAEALALEIPVIASNYSGNTDFMEGAFVFPVDIEEVELDRNYGPYLKNSKWANPLAKDAAEKMRIAYENCSKNYENMKSSDNVFDKLDPQKVSEQIKSFLI